MNQPDPKPDDSVAIWDLVIADMRARDQHGRDTYGTPLQAFNGRDGLQDAYEEALDLAVYLRAAIEERRLKANQQAQQVRSVRALIADGGHVQTIFGWAIPIGRLTKLLDDLEAAR
jgi:hypothetical protein